MENSVTNQKTFHAPLVSIIEVEELFHTYSYKLKTSEAIEAESGKLMLLYGNNGSGKTTILNLLYHLIHPEPYGGHRSFVGTVPFKKFKIHLFNGASVSAERSVKSDSISYKIKARSPTHKDVDWTWQPDRRQREKKDPGYLSLCSFLKDLGITFHYLRDTRRVEGRSVMSPAESVRGMIAKMNEEFVFGEEPEERLSPERELQSSIEAVVQWFRQRTLSATNVGYTSVNTIYRDIIRNIVKPSTAKDTLPDKHVNQLVEALSQLSERNSSFARFGLTPEMVINDIVRFLKSAKPAHSVMLSTVVGPYLDGHHARLDALQELQEVMNSFVTLLQKFYSHKLISVHLEEGIQIRTDTGQILTPEMLSSGEKQLLLLFCNSISARSDRTILMIDEPEISLNVEWQRQLIPALLTCMSGTAFQIILATHSIELLAQYRESVTPLNNLIESNEK